MFPTSFGGLGPNFIFAIFFLRTLQYPMFQDKCVWIQLCEGDNNSALGVCMIALPPMTPHHRHHSSFIPSSREEPWLRSTQGLRRRGKPSGWQDGRRYGVNPVGKREAVFAASCCIFTAIVWFVNRVFVPVLGSFLLTLRCVVCVVLRGPLLQVTG